MKKFARVFVLITGIIWAGYGVAVVFWPQIISTLTGIVIDHWTASLEVQAWYLVTEIAFGMLAYHGWKEPEKYLQLNLLIWMVVFTLLVLFRFIGTWYYGSYFSFKPGLQYLPDSYHIATAYAYELPSMLIYIWLWLNCKKL